jgi:hypothetical protein
LFILSHFVFEANTIEEQVYREDATGKAATVAAPSERQEKQYQKQAAWQGGIHFRGLYPGMRVVANTKLDLMTSLKHIFFIFSYFLLF